jgi:UDP-N-acetylmuramoyl-L-alanyl-D-glutamate--2,6-diaminopimelate ligase
MDLQMLIEDLRPTEVSGETKREIDRIEFDSRKVTSGCLFVAVRGLRADGHDFIGRAVESGAAAVVAEILPERREEGVAFIKVTNSAEALGIIAHKFFDKPSEKLKLVAVTGTNGKTTTATLLYNLFQELGYKAGLLSTIENRIGRARVAADYTTPDAPGINSLLAEMVNAGCDYVFMEASSHAIDQRRIAGLHFAGGVFTNISHEHLDYHKTFQAYINAKKRFFDNLPATAFALVNIDDRRAEVMVQNTRAAVKTYSLRRMADFKAKVLHNSISGLHLDIDGEEFFGKLIGEFNAYNLLAVYGAAVLLGQEKIETLTALSKLGAAEGRFDYIVDQQKDVTAIVDYAHTPDALEKVLSTIHSLKKGDGRIITVVGCGGDRDRAKRPIMAKVACDNSEQVILTSDNPRSEEPDSIIREMQGGVPPYAVKKVLTIADRREAIRTSCRMAQNGDIILVAGKGHEKYQEIKGVRYPFDDMEVLKTELST